jgi:hypothetical protein
MRTNLQPATKLALAFGLAASAFAFAGARSAIAQSAYQSSQTDSTADIRLGAYFPSNSTIKSEVTNTIADGGIDFYLNHNAGQKDIVSVDYIDHGSAGHRLQIVPVTFGQQNYQYSGGFYGHSYYGYGVGAYFVNQDIIDPFGFRETHHTALYGGYINIGDDIARGLFVDVRYHFTSSTGTANPGGLEVTGGFRF